MCGLVQKINRIITFSFSVGFYKELNDLRATKRGVTVLKHFLMKTATTNQPLFHVFKSSGKDPLVLVEILWPCTLECLQFEYQLL